MIKKIMILCAVILSGLTATAQKPANKFNEYFEVDPVVLEDGTGVVKVYFYTECDYVDGIQMEIHLPEGFTIETNKRSGKPVITFQNGDDEDAVTFDHAADALYHSNGNYYMMIGDSPTCTYMLTGHHLLFTFKIIAPENFEGTADASLQDIKVGGSVEDPVTRFCDDANFIITTDPSTTGIGAVEVEGTDEVIYDLQGRRVNRPLIPGVYIINGEKVLIDNK